jgi:Domain of unknown function (DUF6919)
MDAGGDPWAQPLDLAELGELTAQWLEGAIDGSPWNGDSPPDDETQPLAAYLAAMNRRGYITDFSQPGIPGGQRAAVSGFCEKPQAACLASLSLESDLVVVSEYPGGEATYEIIVTKDEGRAFTRITGAGVIVGGMPGFHLDTLLRLTDCYYVSIFDPRWGRDDRLWPSAVAALERDPRDCANSLMPSDDWG